MHFLCLIPLQVLIANDIRLFGYINPQICILFVLWHPLQRKSLSTLLYTFLFGFIIDLFSNSGGVNTAALLVIIFMRITLLSVLLRNRELELQTSSYQYLNYFQQIIYIFILAFIHQLIIYSLEYYSIIYAFTILSKSIVSSLFTTFIISIILFIFRPIDKT